MDESPDSLRSTSHQLQIPIQLQHQDHSSFMQRIGAINKSPPINIHIHININRKKDKNNNVTGVFKEKEILEPLDIKFHKCFSYYGELELTNSHLRGTHVGIEFFKDSKSYLNNMGIMDKAKNITFSNVKIHEIGPYHADILFIWEVTSNWCNGQVLTLSILSSSYIEISNSYFNYTSLFCFFKIIDTNYLLIDNTEFYVDGYNNLEYNKDKYFYSADYSLYPWSFHHHHNLLIL